MRRAEKISGCTFFDSFFSAASCKKGIKNGAARKFFGPSYFVTALASYLLSFRSIHNNLNFANPRKTS